MNHTEKENLSVLSDRRQNSQKGALMIGLIITMVILCALGASIVYVFSSSTLNPISGNYALRAYYNAEAGFRYVTTLYRKTGDKTVFNTYLSTGTPPTISLPGGGSAKVSILNFVNSASTSSTANGQQEIARGGNLLLADASGFDAAGGFFTIGTDTYRYSQRVVNQLQGISGFNSTITVVNGATVKPKEHIRITSKGAYGSGFWNISRTVTYNWPLSGIPGGGTGDPQVIDMSTVHGGSQGNPTGQFAMGTHRSGNTALQITQIDGPNSPNPEAYGTPTFPSGTDNPLYQAWTNTGGYLSYDLQVKIAEQHNQQPSQYNPSTHYSWGDVVWYGNDTTYYELDRQWGDWIRVYFVYGFGVFFRINVLTPQTTAYGLAFFRGQREVDDVPLTMIPPGLPDHTPSILLFARDGNQANDTNWLAYMMLNGGVQHQTDSAYLSYAVDPYGFLKDWSTVMVRVVEAASIKLAAETVASEINVGDTITGGSGTAKVVMKIHDGDGKVVLLLNNVDGTFSRPSSVGSYPTTSAWSNGIDCTNGYCPKDNYIWAFLADTSPHGSDSTATNNIRLEEIPVQNGGTIRWAPTDIQAWTSTDDHFTLVQWAPSLNLAVDSSLWLMGAGKEANAILRSKKYSSASTGSQPPTSTSYWTAVTASAWSNTNNYNSGTVVSNSGTYYVALSATSYVSSPPPPVETAHWTSVTPTAWSSSTSYIRNSLVTYLGNYYRCTNNTTVTGPAITNTTYWTRIPTNPPNYSGTTTYDIGDSVTYNFRKFACRINGTRAISPPNSTTSNTNWLYVGGTLPNWNQNSIYNPGDCVDTNVGTRDYVCILTTTMSGENPTDTTHWSLVTPTVWSGTTLYNTNNFVTYQSNYYRCTNDTHFSLSQDITNQSYWQSVAPWSGTSSYAVGDFVTYNNLCYRCIKSTTPTTSTDFPPELGIIAKGVTAEQFFYDDLAYRVLFGAGAATPYVSPVQQ